MRCPVYRNLDQPFQVLGFRPPELVVISLIFVGGGELGQAFGFGRVWAILATVFSAFLLFFFRRSFGEYFGRRVIRFLRLPSFLSPRLFHLERMKR